MREVIQWYLLLQLFGVIGLPIAQRLFSALPSRGYVFAKPLLLLLVGYTFWLLGSFGFFLNTTSAAGLVLIGFAVWAAALAWQDRKSLREWLRAQRAFVLMSELVFGACFVWWLVYRAYNPDLTTTEKPMDFLFLNSMLRSPDMPPRDPWLAGAAISYYYFGYLLNAILIRLSAVSAGAGFSLALATIMGLAASGAYAIGYDLIRLREQGVAGGGQTMGAEPRSPTLSPRPPAPSPRPLTPSARPPIPTLLYPLFAAFFLVVSSNLAGALELLNANGIGSSEFYQLLNIRNFPPTYNSPTGLPTDNWWWWRASRVLSEGNLEIISEFPFFSFIIADLHPHVMALPFTVLAIALALQTLLAAPSRWFWLYPVILGALGFMNSWDFPTYLGLIVLAYALNRYRVEGANIAFVLDVAQFALIVGGLGLALYLPFYLAFSSQARGIAFWWGRRTTFAHLLLFWGFFLFIITSFVIAQWRALSQLMTQGTRWLAYGVAWLFVIGIAAVLSSVAAMIAAWLMALLGILLWHHYATPAEYDGAGADGATVFAALMLIVGLALVFIVEFFFINDSFGTRMNSVFKFYYQSWTLIAIASGYLVYRLLNPQTQTAEYAPHTTQHAPRNAQHESQSANRESSSPAFASSPVLRLLWLVCFIPLFIATLLYPLAAFMTQTNGLKGEPFINGMENLRRYHPGDIAAIEWLQANAPVDAVIVEAVGGDYSDHGRVAARSGIPSVLNWPGHQLQWRGNGDEAARREPDVQAIYTSPDLKRVRELLQQYDVMYIIVGDLELKKYGERMPFTRAPQLAEKIFDQQGTAIWRVKVVNGTN